MVHTIYWLSRKSNEFGIPLAYYFDINNPSNHNNTKNPSRNSLSKSTQIKKQNSTTKSDYTTGSSYYTSFSNSSLNQYSSSLSSSSSFSNNNSNSSNSLLATSNQKTKLTKKNTTNIEQSSTSPDEILSASLQSSSSFDCVDDINTNRNINSTNKNMSYIYKPNGTGNKLNAKPLKPLQINSNEYNPNNKKFNNNSQSNLKDSVETIDSLSNKNNSDNNLSSSSPSSSISSNLNSNCINNTNTTTNTNGNLELDTNNSVTNSNKNNNETLGSQEDLGLIESAMSPISSTNSALSPHLVSNCNNNSSSNNNVQTIPTRFIDRRVSNGVAQSDPYKFNVNYSEAGQRLARKAQEQLKTVEKSKEETQEVIITTSSNRRNSDYFGNNNDEAPIGDDWQNVSWLGLVFILFFNSILPSLFI